MSSACEIGRIDIMKEMLFGQPGDARISQQLKHHRTAAAHREADEIRIADFHGLSDSRAAVLQALLQFLHIKICASYLTADREYATRIVIKTLHFDVLAINL